MRRKLYIVLPLVACALVLAWPWSRPSTERLAFAFGVLCVCARIVLQ